MIVLVECTRGLGSLIERWSLVFWLGKFFFFFGLFRKKFVKYSTASSSLSRSDYNDELRRFLARWGRSEEASRFFPSRFRVVLVPGARNVSELYCISQ